MKPGAVIVDVAIDQGGCFETSHATTHADPTYVVDGVVHYCVANMPGRGGAHLHLRAQQRHARPRTGAGRQGLAAGAATEDPHLRAGLNVVHGQVTYEAVAHDLGYPWHDPLTLLGALPPITAH